MESVWNSSEMIPDGWDLEFVMKEDGSVLPLFTNPATSKHFHSYADLMLYVNNVQQRIDSTYQQANKRPRITAPIFEKKGMLALPKRPSSNSNSSTAESSSDPKPSTLSRCASNEKDPDYLPKSEINVAADQKLNEEQDNQN